MDTRMPRPRITVQEAMRALFNESNQRKLNRLKKQYGEPEIVSFWIIEICVTNYVELLESNYQTPKRICKSCRGKGKRRCHDCNHGRVACTYCRGHGRITGHMGHGGMNADVPCPTCNEGCTERCRSCRGNGFKKCISCEKNYWDGTQKNGAPVNSRETKTWLNRQGLPREVLERARGIPNVYSIDMPGRLITTIQRKVQKLTCTANQKLKNDTTVSQRYHTRVIPVHQVDFPKGEIPSRLIIGTNKEVHCAMEYYFR